MNIFFISDDEERKRHKQNVTKKNEKEEEEDDKLINLSDVYRNSIVNTALLDIIQTFFGKGFDLNECLISCSLYFDLLNEIRKSIKFFIFPKF